jgi:hypothetical protein
MEVKHLLDGEQSLNWIKTSCYNMGFTLNFCLWFFLINNLGFAFWLIKIVVHVGVMHSFVCAFIIHDTAPCDVLCFLLLYSCFWSWYYLQWWHFALLCLCFSLWCFMWKIGTPMKEKRTHTFQCDIFTNE